MKIVVMVQAGDSMSEAEDIYDKIISELKVVDLTVEIGLEATPVHSETKTGHYEEVRKN